MYKGWINYVFSAVSPHFPMLQKWALHAVYDILALLVASQITFGTGLFGMTLAIGISPWH
jgi:hypothetical protein